MNRKSQVGMVMTLLCLPLVLIMLCNVSMVVTFISALSGAFSMTGAANAYLGQESTGGGGACGIPDNGEAATPGGQAGETYNTLSGPQKKNAQTIIGVGKQDNVPEFGWVVALMVAMQEARMLNLASHANPDSINYPNDGIDKGDHDSVGIFQQRDGWGPMADRMNVATSAHMFYTGGKAGQRGLLDIPDWQRLAPGAAAQAVQVSAYPDAYDKWQMLARDIVANLGGSSSPVSGGGQYQCGNGTGMNCPPTGMSAERGLTPDALRVMRCVHQNFPMIKTFYGIGEREGPSDHPVGKAVDIMIPEYQTGAGNDLGWQIARWVQGNTAALGVTYVIFDMKIWSVARNPEGWRHYDRGDPSDPNSSHRNHVHVSVQGNAGSGGGMWGNPLQGGYSISAEFGHCTGAHEGHCHTGIDLAAPMGTTIVAASGGKVVWAKENGGYGNLVRIRHPDGTETYYGHQSQILVTEGATVSVGAPIGKVGSTGHSTGPHLHFEVRPGGGTAIDPKPFMAQRGVTL
jgi:hypothetical protein